MEEGCNIWCKSTCLKYCVWRFLSSFWLIISFCRISSQIIRSGRSDIPLEDVHRALCPLVSVVPTHVPLNETTGDAYTLLQAAQNDLNETAKFQHTSLGQIQRWVGRKDLVEILLSCRYEDSGATRDKNGAGKLGRYGGFENVFVSHAAPEVGIILPLHPILC